MNLTLATGLLLVLLLAVGFDAARNDEEIIEFCESYGVSLTSPAAELPDVGTGPLRWAPVTAGKLAYWRFGTPSDRPPIILIPGYGSTAHDWSPRLLLRLAEDQEVVILDNRGMGHSEDYSSEGLSIEEMARDTAELIQVLELTQPPNVLGVSLGACIALGLAALQPGMAGKVVAIAGTAGGPDAVAPDYGVVSKLLDPDLSLLESLSLLYPLQYPAVARSACELLASGTMASLDRSNATALLRQTQCLAQYLLLDTVVYGSIPNITVPVLLVAGANDEIVPAQNSRDLAAMLSQPWLAVYPEAGHGVFAEYRDDILDLMQLFLSQ